MGTAPRPAVLHLSSAIPSELLREAGAQLPGEACGILLGQAGAAAAGLEDCEIHGWRSITNAAEGDAHFRFDPLAFARGQEQARDLGQAILGVYHSHPTGPGQPSELDEQHARALWWQQPSWAYLIIGPVEKPVERPVARHDATCRAWRLQRGFWREMRVNLLP